MTEKMSRREFESGLIAKTWKDEAFKQELISSPKAVIERELGQQLTEHLEIRVLEENSNTLYLVLPRSPQVTEELSDEALEVIAGGGFIFIQPGEGGAYVVYSEH